MVDVRGAWRESVLAERRDRCPTVASGNSPQNSSPQVSINAYGVVHTFQVIVNTQPPTSEKAAPRLRLFALASSQHSSCRGTGHDAAASVLQSRTCRTTRG